MYRSIYILACFLFRFIFAHGQVMDCYHIDRYNGLPSNQVYSTLVDRHGYLWICTDKGVVRYNGYEFKKYGLAEGLPNEDVWQMIEDRKGRIWLFSIADEVGYMYHNEYRKTFFINNTTPSFRPGEVKFHKNGICFLSPYPARNANNLSNAQGIVIEVNDTLYEFDIYPYLKSGRAFITEYGEIGSVKGDTIFRLSIENGKLVGAVQCEMSDSNQAELQIITERNFPFKSKLVSYSLKNDYIRIFDLTNCERDRMRLGNLLNQKVKISFMYPYKHDIYAITDKNICKLDSNFRISEIFDTKKLSNNKIDIKPTDISYLLDDKYWGVSISTYRDGLYINQPQDVHFQAFNTFNLSNYKFVGSNFINNYWWNSDGAILAKIIDNKKVQLNHKTTMPDIRKIVFYDKEKDLVLTKTPGTNYWLYKDGEMKDVLTKNTSFRDIGIKGERVDFPPVKNYVPYINWRDVVVDSPNIFYAAIGTYGLCRYQILQDTAIINNIDYDIYSHVVYDSLLSEFCAFNKDKIFLFNRKMQKCVISNAMLRNLGFSNIENIIIESNYHNIFIKSFNKLVVFNPLTLTSRQLFKNYNLTEASIYLQNDVLVAVGKFGILFSKIRGVDKISNPIVYPNNKNQYYSFIEDAAVNSDEILLKTDKGAYTVNIPSEEELMKGNSNSTMYNMLLSYNKGLFDIKQNDTFSIDQKNQRLLFDVINPNGNGAVHYSYRMEGDGWHDLNSNELTLPKLQADKYHKLSLIAYDDAWRSSTKNIYLYIVPYWYQTSWGLRAIFIGGMIVLLLLGGIVAVVTRRIVVRKNEKRNLQLGLELNAIYAQINPHFVFNTLNTAQYFIKKKKTDEAYAHVNKFSRLLRAYMRSSRNKYITIEEEIVNLKNYIDLQLERFENRFEYQIIVDPQIDPQKVLLPSLLLQPIVENALNHGLFHKKEKGRLLIEFKPGRNKNEIICVIDDNGVGRKMSKLINENSIMKKESYGDQLIKDLISVFNKYEKMNITMEYIDKIEPLTGTTVLLFIKNPYHDK